MNVVQPKYIGSPKFDLIRSKLTTLANTHSRPITYGALFPMMQFEPDDDPATEIGQMLGEIAEQAHDAGRPLLSALVVSQATRVPSEGFFVLAVSLGKLPTGSTQVQKEEFWKRELTPIYSTQW